MLRRSVVLYALLASAAIVIRPAARADVLVAGYVESSVRRYAEDGTPLKPLVPPGGMSGVVAPAGMTWGPDGFLYVSNQTSVLVPGAPDSVVRVDPATGAVKPFLVLESGYVPAGLRFGPDGNLYVSRNGGQFAGMGTGSVDCFDGATGKFLGPVVTKLTQPTGLLFDADGYLYVSNFGEGSIIKFDGAKAVTLVPPGSGNLAGPSGLQIGPYGGLFVVDLLLGAVRAYDQTTGEFWADFIPADGPLNNQFPSDLLFDRQGYLLVANLGASFKEPTGSVMAFDLGGNYVGDFATGIFGASQLLLTPK